MTLESCLPASRLPSFSVVVPSLNQGPYIRETIDSILGQSGVEVEIIVVDGGSTDETLAVLRSYGDRIAWTSEPDRGQSDAINKGLRRARGEIACYLNSDDVFEPGALARVGRTFVEDSGAQWLFGRCRIVDEQGRSVRSFVERYKRTWARFARNRLALLVLNYVPQPAAFWRSSAMRRVGGIDESLFYAMDYDLWLRLAKLGPPAFVDRYLARFRIHSASKSRNGAKKQLAEACRVAERHGARALAHVHRAHDAATLAFYRSRYESSTAVSHARPCG